MQYQIKFNPTKRNKPYISFGDENDYWHLNELNSCDTKYILDDVLPNLENIWKGEKVPDPSMKHHTIKLIDTYEFGFDATLIDFGKEQSVIRYGFGEGEIKVPSKEIYSFMKEWGEHLKNWKVENPD